MATQTPSKNTKSHSKPAASERDAFTRLAHSTRRSQLSPPASPCLCFLTSLALSCETNKKHDHNPTTQAANLAPVCVSRRLLSSSAYQRVALARQAGDAVHAGLTFEAEEEDHDNEEQDDAWLEGGGLDMVGSGGVVKEERSGTRDDVLDGMEIDGMLTGAINVLAGFCSLLGL